jgi:hypothetical protein
LQGATLEQNINSPGLLWLPGGCGCQYGCICRLRSCTLLISLYPHQLSFHSCAGFALSPHLPPFLVLENPYHSREVGGANRLDRAVVQPRGNQGFKYPALLPNAPFFKPVKPRIPNQDERFPCLVGPCYGWWWWWSVLPTHVVTDGRNSSKSRIYPVPLVALMDLHSVFDPGKPTGIHCLASDWIPACGRCLWGSCAQHERLRELGGCYYHILSTELAKPLPKVTYLELQDALSFV